MTISFVFLFQILPHFLSAEEIPLANPQAEALALKNEGLYDEAAQILRDAIALEPENVDYQFELANLLAIQQDELVKNSPKSEDTRFLDEAARALEQAVMIRPEFLAARYNLGVVYKRQGHFEKAREQFKEVVKLDPNSPSGYIQIGSTYEEQGFFDEAQDYYMQAKERNVTDGTIDALLMDLDKRRLESRQKSSIESANEMMSRFNRSFNYSPYSHAAGYYADRQNQAQSQSGLQQAMPYVGAWLIDQFMKRRNQNQ